MSYAGQAVESCPEERDRPTKSRLRSIARSFADRSLADHGLLDLWGLHPSRRRAGNCGAHETSKVRERPGETASYRGGFHSDDTSWRSTV